MCLSVCVCTRDVCVILFVSVFVHCLCVYVFAAGPHSAALCMSHRRCECSVAAGEPWGLGEHRKHGALACVCESVRVYVCMCESVYVGVCICVCVCERVFVCVWFSLCVYVCVWAV